MNMRYSDRKSQSKIRMLRVVFVLVLFAGLFVQITMLARISAENKRADAAEKEILTLNHRIENLERDIANYHNAGEIEALALAMGMQNPDPSQLRSISVPDSEE